MSEKRHETFRETPLRAEVYRESFEREWEHIHEGTKPETGLKEKGRRERKEMCEDVKLKSREKGLFLVADGVPVANGWLAARETARVMYDLLGEALDQAVENNLTEATRKGENPIERITQYVAMQIKKAAADADTRIRALSTRGEPDVSTTTLSLVKIVKLPRPEGVSIQRMFFSAIGNSRIYLQRKGGSFNQITIDDSRLQGWVDRGDLTSAQARAIDQAQRVTDLNPELRRYAADRAVLTKSLGGDDGATSMNVQYVDLQPGDRFVIVSDGVSDSLRESEIKERLDGEVHDDRAESVLQQAAMDMSLKGTDPRSVADDISALVYTIEQNGPDRGYLHRESQQEHSVDEREDRINAMQEGFSRAREWMEHVEARIQATDSQTPQRNRLALQIERQKAIEALESYRYHLEKARLDLFDLRFPPRFRTGDRVQVWRDDFDPPSLDRQPWTVVSYDPTTKHYQLRGPGGQWRDISRYALETVQTGLLVKIGDEFPVQVDPNIQDQGFKILGFDKGDVVFAKEIGNSVKQIRRPVRDVNEIFFDLTFQAEQVFQMMNQAAQAYGSAEQVRKNLQDETMLIDRLRITE